jgi:hypothetical protein
MKFYILVESPPHSATFVRTGEEIETSFEAAAQYCADLSAANGGRYAMEPYDPVRREVKPGATVTPPAAPEAA